MISPYMGNSMKTTMTSTSNISRPALPAQTATAGQTDAAQLPSSPLPICDAVFQSFSPSHRKTGLHRTTLIRRRHQHSIKHLVSLQFWYLVSAGVGNLRPVGRMRLFIPLQAKRVGR